MRLIRQLYDIQEANVFSTIKDAFVGLWKRITRFIKSSLNRLYFGQKTSIPIKIQNMGESTILLGESNTAHGNLTEFYVGLYLLENMKEIGMDVKNYESSKKTFNEGIKNYKSIIEKSGKSEEQKERDKERSYNSGKVGATELFEAFIESKDIGLCEHIFEVKHAGSDMADAGSKGDITINVYKRSTQKMAKHLNKHIKEIGISLKSYKEGSSGSMTLHQGNPLSVLGYFFKHTDFGSEIPLNSRKNAPMITQDVIERNFGSKWANRFKNEYHPDTGNYVTKNNKRDEVAKFLVDFLTAQYKTHRESINKGFIEMVGIGNKSNDSKFVEVSYWTFMGKRNGNDDPKIISTMNSHISKDYKTFVKGYLNENINLGFKTSGGGKGIQITSSVGSQKLASFNMTVSQSSSSSGKKPLMWTNLKSKERGGYDYRKDSPTVNRNLRGDNRSKYGLGDEFKDDIPYTNTSAKPIKARSSSQSDAKTSPKPAPPAPVRKAGTLNNALEYAKDEVSDLGLKRYIPNHPNIIELAKDISDSENVSMNDAHLAIKKAIEGNMTESFIGFLIST